MADVDKIMVEHIAKLARLNLSEKEIEGYTNDLISILEMANIINNINDVKETIGANIKYNVFRKDEIKNFENRELLLQNAPSQDEGMFRIPKVIN